MGILNSILPGNTKADQDLIAVSDNHSCADRVRDPDCNPGQCRDSSITSHSPTETLVPPAAIISSLDIKTDFVNRSGHLGDTISTHCKGTADTSTTRGDAPEKSTPPNQPSPLTKCRPISPTSGIQSAVATQLPGGTEPSDVGGLAEAQQYVTSHLEQVVRLDKNKQESPLVQESTCDPAKAAIPKSTNRLPSATVNRHRHRNISQPLVKKPGKQNRRNKPHQVSVHKRAAKLLPPKPIAEAHSAVDSMAICYKKLDSSASKNSAVRVYTVSPKNPANSQIPIPLKKVSMTDAAEVTTLKTVAKQVLQNNRRAYSQSAKQVEQQSREKTDHGLSVATPQTVDQPALQTSSVDKADAPSQPQHSCQYSRPNSYIQAIETPPHIISVKSPRVPCADGTPGNGKATAVLVSSSQGLEEQSKERGMTTMETAVTIEGGMEKKEEESVTKVPPCMAAVQPQDEDICSTRPHDAKAKTTHGSHGADTRSSSSTRVTIGANAITIVKKSTHTTQVCGGNPTGKTQIAAATFSTMMPVDNSASKGDFIMGAKTNVTTNITMSTAVNKTMSSVSPASPHYTVTSSNATHEAVATSSTAAKSKASSAHPRYGATSAGEVIKAKGEEDMAPVRRGTGRFPPFVVEGECKHRTANKASKHLERSPQGRR
ncbi:mucin-4-like isoform X1 [Lethenteron reissneri]|nr:mucin-4-like isoform X1 [Lethenteron reissneri]